MDISDIISNLPKLQAPPVVKKPAYFFFGKPGSGKTTVAQELVKTLTLEYVEPQSLLEKSVNNNEDLLNQLKSGKELQSDVVEKLVKDKVEAPESIFKGSFQPSQLFSKI